MDRVDLVGGQGNRLLGESEMSVRVVVLGGGIGGLVVASELKARVKDAASVTLIDRKKFFEFPPSFPWLVMGDRKPEQVRRPLAPLNGKGIRVLHAEIGGVDLDGKHVRTSHESLPYDYLVVALGAEYAPETVPGYSEHAMHMYDLESALRLKEAVGAFPGGRVAVGVARLPFKCPTAPYEMALLLDDIFRRRGIREKVSLDFFTPEVAPLPSAGPEHGRTVATWLEKRGIRYHPKRKLRSIGPDSLAFEEGDPLSFDLLVCVPPHRAPRPVVEAGMTDPSGWIPVNSRTMETKHPGVFAVGDITGLPTPNGYTPFLSKAGVFAHGQAEVVAHNLAVQITGRGHEKSWDGHGACFLEVARGKSAYMSGNFLAAPRPHLTFRTPRAIYHTQKVLFEKYWMQHWF